jgi:uncharacterized membrane protein
VFAVYLHPNLKRIKNSSMMSQNRPASYQKLTADQKRKIVQNAKTYGDLRKIANKLGVSASAVSYVVSGRYNNTRILNAAYDLVRGRKSAKASL